MNTQDILLKIDPKSNNLVEQQSHLENLSRGLGIEQYRKNLESTVKGGRESATSYGQTLMMTYVSKIADAIRLVKDQKGSVGRNNLALKYYEEIEPEVLAFISLRGVLDNITEKAALTNVASKIGRIIELEIQTRVLKEKNEDEFKKAKAKLKKATTSKHRRALVGSIYNRIKIAKDGIDQATAIKLGVKLIEVIVSTTGLVEIEMTREKKRTYNHIIPTEELSKWISDKNAHCELLSPVYMPCVIPPKGWSSPKKGGYHSKFHKDIKLVKTKGETQLYRQLLARTPMPKVYQTINTLQNTAWKINSDVHKVMTEVYFNGIDLGDALVPFEDHSEAKCDACGSLVPISKTNQRNTSADHECFSKDADGKDNEITKRWKRKARELHEANIKLRSRRLSISKVLWVANLLDGFESIYFPYNMDFRGRIYAIPNHLNPQAADYAKGLLTFSKGMPIEDSLAGSWLAIQGANTYGEDKVSFSDRVSFIGGLEEEIRATVADPIGTKGFWTKADKPWQFLAFCFEWVGYLNAEANGDTFVSHLPIAQDGSCSGIQHFSAMLRDEEGGKAVNLVPMETPQDIYQVVCDKVIFKFGQEARGSYTAKPGYEDAEFTPPNKFAQYLSTLTLDRKFTKRQVMTVPYGLTQISCTEYTKEYFSDLGVKLPWSDKEHDAVCMYASKIMWGCIQDTVVGAREAMKWLQDVVKVTHATKNVPIVWNTPWGLPVMQSYRRHDVAKGSVTSEGGLRIQSNIGKQRNEGVRLVRMKAGVAPNFVHSMDASHLGLTICASKDNHAIEDFAVIHDSFGTHAANSEHLATTLRQTFVAMYSETNVLEGFLRDMGEVVGEWPEVGDADDDFEGLPELPDKQLLELAQVVDSSYFFA